MKYKCNRDCVHRSNTGRCKYTGEMSGKLVEGKIEIKSCGYTQKEGE